MPETVVLCGGVAAPIRRAKKLHLSVAGPGTNIELHSDDIGRRMLRSLPRTLADLLDIATYVYAADQLVSRGGETASRLGSDWRRELRFIVPVREPELWSSPEVVGSLERLLGFMSEDSMRFEFVGASHQPAKTDYFDFGENIEEVALFSGGLDSLAGAVDKLVNSNSRLLLVSHQSSTKIAHRQKQLAQDLGVRFPNRVVHVPVRISMKGAEPVERTQRTRSFLFGALGTVVARIAGSARFNLFENGIVSLNLPIASQVVGTAATRTTHPRVIRDLSALLSTVLDREVRVENPYLWKTKGEVAGRLRELGHADLARYTVSCSRVYWLTRLQTHCGCCSQCLDRRFGALAAGFGDDDPAEMYEVDLLTGAREGELDRTMAESFIRHALELGDMTERTFISRFAGEVARAASCVPGVKPDEVARAILDLHHRHAFAIKTVLADGYRSHAAELAAQALPSSCILRMVAGPHGIVTPAAEPPHVASRAQLESRNFRRSSQLRVALDSSGKRLLIGGMPPMEGAATYELMEKLIDRAKKDRAEGVAPESCAYLNARTLSASLGVTEESVRRSVYRVRARTAAAFQSNAGIPLSADALIENSRWKGYRLNPAVLVLAPGELGRAATGHVREPLASRLRK